jgi:hypothetical protein
MENVCSPSSSSTSSFSPSQLVDSLVFLYSASDQAKSSAYVVWLLCCLALVESPINKADVFTPSSSLIDLFPNGKPNPLSVRVDWKYGDLINMVLENVLNDFVHTVESSVCKDVNSGVIWSSNILTNHILSQEKIIIVMMMHVLYHFCYHFLFYFHNSVIGMECDSYLCSHFV